MTPRRCSLALGLVLCSTVACSLLEPGPGATLIQFSRHLEQGEIEDAQNLLSSEYPRAGWRSEASHSLGKFGARHYRKTGDR